MTKDDIRKYLTTIIDEMDEQVTVIGQAFEQDDEGFMILDDGDLSDALRVIMSAVSSLSRLSGKIGREGLTP